MSDTSSTASHGYRRDWERHRELSRAVVALPTIARLRGRELDRKSQTINTAFKEIVDDTLKSRADIDSIWTLEKDKKVKDSSPA